MTSLIRESKANAQPRQPKTTYILAGLMLVGLVAFLVAPGALSAKAHIALHGICAQRPSHSFWLGDTALPLDARMTGIYLASAISLIWFAFLGRLRAARVPSPALLKVLVLFIAAMAFDGANGLMKDLGLWHLYGPTNLSRLITGALAGTSLGVGIAHVFALSMWGNPQPRVAVVERFSEMVPPLMITGFVGLVAATGLPSAYGVLAVGLIGAALVVFWLPSIVVIALVTGRSWSRTQFADLGGIAIFGFMLAVFSLAGLAAWRFFAEWKLGLPKLT